MERKSLKGLFVAGVVLAFAFTASGCVHVRSALYTSAEDAMDIFRADVSVSFGTDMGAHVMASEYVQLKSYSYEDLRRAGFGTRQMGVWKEDRQDLWLGPWRIGSGYIRSKSVKALGGAALPAKLKSGRNAAMGLIGESTDEVGVGLHVFVVGFRIGVRPVEFVDFLTSPFGLDLADDDLSWQQRKVLREARRRAKEAAKKTPPPCEDQDKGGDGP